MALVFLVARQLLGFMRGRPHDQLEESSVVRIEEGDEYEDFPVTKRNDFEHFSKKDLENIHLPADNPESLLSIFVLTPELKKVLGRICAAMDLPQVFEDE